MINLDPTQPTGWPTELKALLRKLGNETIFLALAGLALIAVILAGAAGASYSVDQGITWALVLLGLTGITWYLHQRSYLATALVLVAGCLIAVLFLVTREGLELTLLLLILPVGLATLTISRGAGLVTAGLCTILLLFAPSTVLPDIPLLRTVVALGIWGTVGMIWLTLRPLLTSMYWVWSSYERGQDLLENSRDYQLQLKQALEDLADANVQLTRLNQQTHALRQIAERERRAKEQFVANVSHELRTPLNMIIGFCEMITQSPETYGENISQTLLADLAVVLRNSQHLSSLINDVLDLSQVDAGQMALSKERVAMAEIVETVAVAVRPLFESKGLSLTIDVDGGLPLISCDRTRIREVLLNLLSNAGRFTDQGGVQVYAWQEGDAVVVKVADTGPGIAEHDKAKLFQPFHQLDGSVKQRSGGTGLGLSISKRFVELHEGQMWVESEIGQGATFFFSLPIDPPVPESIRAASRLIPDWEYLQRTRLSRVPTPNIRPRLVVVEEGNALQLLLDRYLDDIEVISLPDLEKAVNDLSQTPAQALLVNEADVGCVLRQIDAATGIQYGIPVIVCSVPGAEQIAASLGARDYLLKPISREALLQTLSGLEEEIETVLVVDDEMDALRLFGRILGEADRGYRVLRASDGRQALEILRHESVDVVLLDLAMPEMDGFQLLAVKNEDPALRDIPVILISARDPLGKPLASNALAVTRSGGLSMRNLLMCVEVFSRMLSPTADPVPPEMLPG